MYVQNIVAKRKGNMNLTCRMRDRKSKHETIKTQE